MCPKDRYLSIEPIKIFKIKSVHYYMLQEASAYCRLSKLDSARTYSAIFANISIGRYISVFLADTNILFENPRSSHTFSATLFLLLSQGRGRPGLISDQACGPRGVRYMP